MPRPPTRRQPVGGTHERRFVRDLGRHLRDDAAVVDDHGPVAGELHFFQFRGVEQHGCARLRQVPQQVVDLPLGTDVDAARGVEAEQRLHAAGDPAGDGHLLLVAAGEAAHLTLGARVDLEPLDALVHHLLLATHADGAPASRPGQVGQGDVLAHGALRQQGLHAVAGHVHESLGDGICRVAEAHLLPVHEDAAAGRPTRTGEDAEELVLALPLQPHEAQDLARVQGERDTGQLVPDRQVPKLDARRAGAGRRTDAASPGHHSLVDGRLGVAGWAEHEVDDPLLSTRAHLLHDTHGLPVAKHRRPVAQRADLQEPVGDEDDGLAGLTSPAHDVEHTLCQVGGQRRGHLVKQQHVGARWPTPGPGPGCAGPPAAGRAPWRAGRGGGRRAWRPSP